MPNRRNTHNKRSKAAYLGLMLTALTVGTMPAMFAVGVDPYELLGPTQRPTSITDIAEKAHYPLWKLAKYKVGSHETIVLGDSRARALRDKYWQELGLSSTLNLAYGGGTIPEIYETYKIIKSDASVANLVIGIQLRSFDEDHKSGMNRVPEAVKILEHKFEYLKNWSVIKTAWNVFYKENEKLLESTNRAIPGLVSEAKADLIDASQTIAMKDLLDPEICFSCTLPQNLAAIVRPQQVAGNWTGIRKGYFRGFGYLNQSDWGHVAAWYAHNTAFEQLPTKMEKQILGSGKADWVGFDFSQTYWDYLVEISKWAKTNNKRLIFVIPPTVDKLQATITDAGLKQLSHQFRLELAQLGTVVDFDFPNPVTADSSKFSDAYHFNSSLARQITGEVAVQISSETAFEKRFIQHRSNFNCVDGERETLMNQIRKTAVEVLKGSNCRIWAGVSR